MHLQPHIYNFWEIEYFCQSAEESENAKVENKSKRKQYT